jgi:hypothetical protein
MKNPDQDHGQDAPFHRAPVGDALRGDGETDVVEALKDDAADVVGLRQFGVETFQDPHRASVAGTAPILAGSAR